MRIYRYWVEQCGVIAKPDGGTPQFTRVYGYSNRSPEEAEQLALRLFSEVEQRINGQLVEWQYEEKPIREEILHELSPQNIITRNRYGAEVLNSENLVFIDIDGFRQVPPFTRLLRLLTGREQPSPEEYTLEQIRKTASSREYASCAIRVYRTCAGFRLILSGGEFPPGSEKTRKLMRRFGADMLYANLCVAQNCFRARLTPKPNRIHLRSRRFAWPRPADSEMETAAWLKAYSEKSEPYAVCRYLETIHEIADDAGNPVIRHHDEATGAFSGKPLA